MIVPISLLMANANTEPTFTIGQIAMLLYGFGKYLCYEDRKNDVVENPKR